MMTMEARLSAQQWNNSQVINRNRGVASSCPESHKSQRLKALVTALPELIAYTHADDDANDENERDEDWSQFSAP